MIQFAQINASHYAISSAESGVFGMGVLALLLRSRNWLSRDFVSSRIRDMGNDIVNEARLDRSVISESRLHEHSDDREYWLSQTPAERLAAMELMRQIAYGYDPATTRLQRVFEFAERSRG